MRVSGCFSPVGSEASSYLQVSINSFHHFNVPAALLTLVADMATMEKQLPMSPNKPSILKASTGKILQLGSKMGAYIFLSETFERSSLGMVSFEVRNWPNSDV